MALVFLVAPKFESYGHPIFFFFLKKALSKASCLFFLQSLLNLNITENFSRKKSDLWISNDFFQLVEILLILMKRTGRYKLQVSFLRVP